MRTITFTCETITPMFLSGADGQTPELRPPSIKGALRFWWRAMNGHLSLEELKKQEAMIFGGVDPKAVKSKVIIRLTEKRLDKLEDKTRDKSEFPTNYQVQQGNYPMSAIDFLAYGVQNFDRNKSFNRDYLKTLKKFEFKVTLPTEIEEEILKAFYLFSYFGGLGSKNRNGFGSFVIKNELINPNLKDCSKLLSSFLSISQSTQLFIGKEHLNAYDALGELGVAYHTAKNSLTSNEKQYIALPMQGSNYPLNKLERHTKPYFLSVHKTDNEEKPYQGKILFLPYKYLEGYKDKRGNPIRNLSDHQANYLEVTDKLNNKFQELLTEAIL